MSSSIGNNMLNQSLLQSKLNSSGIPANTLFQASRVNAPRRKSQSSKKFSGNKLVVGKPDLAMGSRRRSSTVPRAVLATDSDTKPLAEKFNLDGSIELQVIASAPTPGSPTQVEIHVTYSSDSLLLHWGVIRDRKEKWVLPSRRPGGTKEYKNRALRTPFSKSGSNSFLKIEIDDPEVQALEFLMVDESKNKWFKNNGNNFHVKLPEKKEQISSVSVPEDLVQIQAYLRWERNGKQMYTPQKEREEYEAARAELLDEVARGTSIQELRARLTKKNDDSNMKEPSLPVSRGIPDDLVQVQAYIRWEKAGKPNYSEEHQLREFEEARKELQMELEKGLSLDEIRKKVMKGEIQTTVAKQLQDKKYFRVERIQRKKRDLMHILNKYAAKPVDEKVSIKPKALTAVELFAKAKEEEHDGQTVLNRNIFKIDNKELLVLVTKPAGKTKILLATDLKEPITLHWALSKNNAGEWLVLLCLLLMRGCPRCLC